MPSQNTPSFASAAAGRAGTSRTGGSNEWNRSRNVNGTVTLGRRPSTTPFAQPLSQDTPPPLTAEPPVLPQQVVASREQPEDYTYSRDDFQAAFRAQEDSRWADEDLSGVYALGFDPENSSSTNGRSSWARGSDARENSWITHFWDSTGRQGLATINPMTEEEQELFSDVNSTVKPLNQNPERNTGAPGLNGRKASISQSQGSGHGLSSPASSRPSTRRQQTADSIQGLSSPTGRFARDESSPFFNRKDPTDERTEDKRPTLPFNLARSNTAGNSLGHGPSSPWGTGPTAMSPMGTFGSFPLGGAGNPPAPSDKRPGFGSLRADSQQSRLAHLMQKDSTEDMSMKAAERPWRSRQRTDTTDTDPFGEERPSGSAALGGGQDTSPPPNPQLRAPGLDTPTRGNSGDLGMSDAPSFRASSHGHNHQTPHREEHEPLSPATNPYASPPETRQGHDGGSYDGEPLGQSRPQGLGGIPEHPSNPLGAIPRGFRDAAFDGSDRSQTSSAGGNRNLPPLGGLPSLSNLGGLSGAWPSNNPIGTPDREQRQGFTGGLGSSLFGSMGGDLQSPGVGGLGNMFSPPSASLSGTAGRGSKLGSLFPSAMQQQMHGHDNENTTDSGDNRQNNAFGAIGKGFAPSRDTDSPMRGGRHPFEDLFPSSDASRNQSGGLFSSSENTQGQTSTAFPHGQTSQPGFHQSAASSDSASNQPPTAQQRMMVMPDRMRWVYLDPQGQVQGPWSGLEMHDWYKASFFTPDLSVKKVEDTEFEPLGQLIRRIGNSREPFLVPQIGIPHGAPSTQAGSAFTPAAAAPGSAAAQSGSVQPPFAGAFPSFGTTLTAEQQNNLERRKQEEQYLMARQREFLAQQQVNMKQMQMGGLPSGLHHHSSAQSLHSQPSFGSITSPIGMPSQPPLPGVSGYFDPSRQPPNQSIPDSFFREDELARLSLQDRQQLFGAAAGTSQQPTAAQQIVSMFGQHPDSQNEPNSTEQIRQNDPQGFRARLQEFQQLREQHESDEAVRASVGVSGELSGSTKQAHQHQEEYIERRPESRPEKEAEPAKPEVLSLTQQVQKAASAKQSPTITANPDSPWGKINNSGMPMPFPPPQSTTPLPAPTAQRGRSTLPEALNAESRSRSESPEATTPSVAPWAKENAEATKGPSLKDIQAAEAKKAALREEKAAAARRALYEREMKALAIQPVAPAPGLPTSSTWGNSASPGTPVNAPSPWAKPTVAQVQAMSKTAAGKKTLADIQKEEELRKQKVSSVVQASTQPVQGTSGVKRYADLAGKAMSSAAPVVGAGWSTVGAGGKAKIPTGPASATNQAIRATSSAAIPSIARAPIRPSSTRSVTNAGQSNSTSANDEFLKWVKGALTKGVNPDINVDEFVNMLSTFPLEVETIRDTIYTASKVMNGQEFAEEYIRRRMLADKGVFESANVGPGSSGGWSEVAKKGPPKEEPSSGFKVVPNKKKGKK